jgi:N-acetylglucosamine-6-phosphate deacetylase
VTSGRTSGPRRGETGLRRLPASPARASRAEANSAVRVPQLVRLAAVRLGVAAAVVGGELVRGDVELAAGAVAAVGLGAGGKGLAIPGMVDLQVNGYAGVDVLAADADGLAELGRALARSGVTAFQPTLVSAPPEQTRAALERIGLAEERAGARIVGVHLEGPFVSPRRAGAHPPEWLHEPDLDLLASLLVAGCPVTTVTLAPELPGAGELIDELRRRGVAVALGHSDATAAEAHAGFDHGASTVTHLFNAMRPFAARDPGLAGAALARDDVVVQLIADGVHVAPEALLVAWRAARGRIALVTDAIAAAGRGDGAFRLGPVEVEVVQGVARTPDGTLAGGVRPLAWGLRLLIELGVPIAEAVDAVTRTPARVLARPELGSLGPGLPADLVVLGDDFSVERVYLGGRLLE